MKIVSFLQLTKNIDYVLDNISLSIANTPRLGDRIQLKPENKEEEIYNEVSPHAKETEEENGKIFIVVGGCFISRSNFRGF